MDLTKIQERHYWQKSGVALLVCIVVLNSLKGTVADPDLWGYLSFGRLFWEQRRFPYQDPFSYVPTLDPWIYHEWLTGVVFYPLYRALGAPGLQCLKYALGLAAVGLTYLTARKRGADPLSALILLWMIQPFLAMGYSPVRAQVFTYGFFALFLYLLEQARQTGRWRGVWRLIPLQVLWCNLHGGFVAGLGLIALYALGAALSRRPFLPLVGLFLLAAMGTLINPYGPSYWDYLIRAVSMPRPEITEWASLLRAYREGVVGGEEVSYYLTLAAFSLFLGWRARCRETTVILSLAVTWYLGWRHIRHQVFFLLMAGAYLPAMLSAYAADLKSSPLVMDWRRRLGGKIPTLMGALLALAFGYQFLTAAPLDIKIPGHPRYKTPHPLYYPVGAVDYLRRHRLSGNILLEYNWGEYVIWQLYPQCRVALDGRFETVYPEAVAADYFAFIFGRDGWRRFPERYPPDMILIDPRAGVYPLMLEDRHWRQVYHDPGCALFVRGDGNPARRGRGGGPGGKAGDY